MVIDARRTFTTLNWSWNWSQRVSLSQIHQGLTDLFWDKETAQIKVLTFPQTLCPLQRMANLGVQGHLGFTDNGWFITSTDINLSAPPSSPHQEQRGPPLLAFYYLCEKCFSMLHDGAPIISTNVASVFLAQRFKHTDVCLNCACLRYVRVFL